MPDRAIPFAQITVDDARVDGIQGVYTPPWALAMGRVFSFPMRRYRDLKEHEIGPAWYLGRGMEYVPSLRAIAPRGYVQYADMSTSNWDVGAGDVQFVRWAGNGRKKSALFPVTAAPDGAYITQHAGYTAEANEAFEIIVQRWRPPDGATDDCDMWITWAATSGTQWSLRLPFPEPGTGIATGLLDPALWWSLDSGANWSEGKSFKGMRLKSGRGVSEEPDVIRWEPCDGLFLLTCNDEQYFVTCDLDKTGRKWPVATGAGPVKVKVVGHQALVHVQGIRYPSNVTAEVTGYWNAGTSAYGGVYVEERYAWPNQLDPPNDFHGFFISIPKPGDFGAEGVDLSIEDQADFVTRTIRPKLTFTSDSPYRKRALCCLAQLVTEPVYTTPDDLAAQWVSQGKDMLGRVSGHLTDAYKGNTFEADLTCDEGLETALTAWQGGQKVQATVGWQSTDAADDSYIEFTGYMRDGYPQVTKGNRDNLIRVRVSAEDGYAKLADQRCKDCGPFAGWAFVDAFTFLCEMGGIPPAMIYTDDIIPGNLPNAGYLPTRGADPLFEFSSNTSIPSALDMLCAEMSRGSLQVRWGFNITNGKCEAGLKPTYAAPGGGDWTLGGYWTLDDEAVAQHDQVQDITVHQSVRERGNWVAVIAGRAGTETYRVLADLGSIFDPTMPNFIGQIKPEFVHLPDADDDPTAIDELLLKILGDRTERHREITWPTRFHTTVAPDTWVRVQTTHLNVTTNAVFRVTDKSYWAEHGPERSTARETITARQVYYWNGTYYEEVIAA